MRLKPAWIRALRILSQVGFFALLVFVVVGGFCAFQLPAGQSFVCPVGGLQFTLGARALQGSVLLGAALLLVLAVLLGRSFCGWMCPFGTLLDLFRGILRLFPRWRSVKPGTRLAVNTEAPGAPAEPSRGVRYGVLAGSAVGAAALSYPVFCPICPVGATCRSAGLQGVAGGAEMAAVPLIMSLEAWKGRTWCRYLCPIGVFQSLVDRLKFSRIRLPGATCLDCRRCEANCSMGNSPWRATAEQLRRDGAVIRAVAATGRPDLLYRPTKQKDIPGEVRQVLARQEKNYRVPPSECIRCFDCLATCPATKRKDLVS